jgi:hypothetical protein
MRVQETGNATTSRAIYESQQAATQAAQNKIEPTQKDQPAQATGTASSVNTYA